MDLSGDVLGVNGNLSCLVLLKWLGDILKALLVSPFNKASDFQSLADLKRNALLTTLTDERLMAAAAIIGLSSHPVSG